MLGGGCMKTILFIGSIILVGIFNMSIETWQYIGQIVFFILFSLLGIMWALFVIATAQYTRR
jgi:hypothetical protein